MSYVHMTRFQVLDHCRKRIAKAGSLRAWAREIGASAAYVSDVMLGKRDPGPKILAALKIEKLPADQHFYRHIK